MQKTYGLVAASNMQLLKLAPMTLKQAESCRDTLATMGGIALVVNLKAE